ncbi:MAG: hypothetical protein CK540_03720 [Thermoleophilia bacterium]|nr:MAG: hypothetical protein CK540_03720 [Thermoleophilia bacterium]
MTPPDRICVSCGRAFSWRKAWARDWDQVRYCSSACRKRGITTTDKALEATLVDLLAQGSAGSTVCPSEAAHAVGGEDWQKLQEPARRAARRLVATGTFEITQGGRVVDPSTARGPILLRRTS